MSIQDSSSGLSYADHDVHHIRHRALNQPASGGDDYVVNAVEEFEVTERGLDPDELAELRAMRVSVGAEVTAQEPQDSRGEFSFNIDAGFNIGVSDALNQQDTDSTDFDPDGDGTSEARSDVAETDEVGQIYTLSDNYNVGFDDDANGNGGGGSNVPVVETIDFAGMFGEGLYVDSADDFASVIAVKADNVVELVAVNVTYSLYYNVQETEGGRSRFGR